MLKYVVFSLPFFLSGCLTESAQISQSNFEFMRDRHDDCDHDWCDHECDCDDSCDSDTDVDTDADSDTDIDTDVDTAVTGSTAETGVVIETGETGTIIDSGDSGDSGSYTDSGVDTGLIDTGEETLPRVWVQNGCNTCSEGVSWSLTILLVLMIFKNGLGNKK